MKSETPFGDWVESPESNELNEISPLDTLNSFNSSVLGNCVEVPQLSKIARHGIVGQIVEKIEPHSETHPAALLLQFLIAVGNLIGRSAFVRTERDKHYTNLFGIVVGETSRGRKGTAWGHVRYILSLLDSEWTDDRIKGGLASGEGLIGELRDPKEGEESETPNDRRLLIYESEFGGVLRVMQRDGNTLSAIVRNAWDTGNLNILANKYRDKNGQSLRASNCHISMIGHITRAELSKLLSENDAANGFANRMCFCHSARSKVLPEGGAFDQMSFMEEREALDRVVSLAQTRGEMRRTPEAREYWRAIYPELTKEIKGRWGEVTSRGEAQVIRLALLYTLLDGEKEIGVVHLRAAKAMWEYCRESARWAFNESKFSRDAQRILNALEFEPRTLKQISDIFNHNLNQIEIREALKELQDYIEIGERKTPGRSVKVVSLKKQTPTQL